MLKYKIYFGIHTEPRIFLKWCDSHMCFIYKFLEQVYKICFNIKMDKKCMRLHLYSVKSKYICERVVFKWKSAKKS